VQLGAILDSTKALALVEKAIGLAGFHPTFNDYFDSETAFLLPSRRTIRTADL
jgi:hypothetical protein